MKFGKGQEEITGFALIVVIVAVIGVILLVIILKKDSGSSYESLEVQKFLDSAMRIQTDCLIGGNSMTSRMDDLLQECYSNSASSCSNGKDVCKSFEDKIKDIVKKSWAISNQSLYTGYKMSVVFEPRSNSTTLKELYKIEQGNCTSSYFGGESLVPEKNNRGNLVLKMQICISGSKK